MVQLICPACGQAEGFTVIESWPRVTYAVTADGEVTELGGRGQREYKVNCDGCGIQLYGRIFSRILNLVPDSGDDPRSAP